MTRLRYSGVQFACWLALCLALGCSTEPPAGAKPVGAGGGGVGTGGMSGGSVASGNAAGNEGKAGTSQGGNAVAGGKAGSTGEGGMLSAPWVPAFEKRQLSAEFLAEGADVGDIDGDGVFDLVAGPRWYAGPGFELGGVLEATQAPPIADYGDHFLSFLDDLDGDDDLDVVTVGFPGEDARWYEHPAQLSPAVDWPVHTIANDFGNESPAYANLVGDSKKELVFMTSGALGYATRATDPKSPWTFHPIGASPSFSRFTHGLGVGDVNGDGLLDVLERSGVWLQQAVQGAEPSWERLEVDFSLGGDGGAQMHVYDVDGDGDADVISSLSAHEYGLSWFEQGTNGGKPSFTPHEILPPTPTPLSFSQLHAVELADLNGDGLLDVITGKRFYAHAPPQDPGGLDPAVLYWFELKRGQAGVEFVPHQVDDDSGVGCGFVARDVNGDGKPDLATSSKKGTFVHLQQ